MIRADGNATGGPEEAFNPTKWIAGYNSLDSDRCVRDVIVKGGERDPDDILRKCPVGVGGNPTFEPGKQCAGFPDISKDNPYCLSIEFAKNKGWIQGNPDGTFKPNNLVNRAEFSKMTTHAAGFPLMPQYSTLQQISDYLISKLGYSFHFVDVLPNKWFVPYVYTLAGEKVVSSIPLAQQPVQYFHPARNIILPEALKMSMVAFDKQFDTSVTCFDPLLIQPLQNPNVWYRSYLGSGLFHGISPLENGSDVAKATHNITRAEAVDILVKTYKIMENLKPQSKHLSDCPNTSIRLFKTSVEGVKMRSGPSTRTNLSSEINLAKTDVMVLGSAITGEYVDAYKTNRWYLVSYQGKIGYVLATLLHIRELGGKELDDNFVYPGWDRNPKYRVKNIVLHFTGGTGSAIENRNTQAVKNGVGAHYFIDRDGNIAQALPDYKAIGHAGYGGAKQNIRKDGNEFTIGIEIINWGVAKESNGKYLNYKNGIIPNEEVINIEEEYPSISKVWSDGNNFAWADSGVDNVAQKTWQSYPQAQLENLNQLLSYLQERYGIENQYFEYDNPHPYDGLTTDEIKKYSFYFYPNDVNADERIDYNTAIDNFNGIVEHHNITGKYDAGPALNINELN